MFFFTQGEFAWELTRHESLGNVLEMFRKLNKRMEGLYIYCYVTKCLTSRFLLFKKQY